MRVRAYIDRYPEDEMIEKNIAYGISSRIRDGIHVLFADCDFTKNNFGGFIGFLFEIQKSHSLLTIYITQSSLWKWHIASFVAKKFNETVKIVEELVRGGFVEREYLRQSRRESYFVLRVSSKGGFLPRNKIPCQPLSLFKSKHPPPIKLSYYLYKDTCSFAQRIKIFGRCEKCS